MFMENGEKPDMFTVQHVINSKITYLCPQKEKGIKNIIGFSKATHTRIKR